MKAKPTCQEIAKALCKQDFIDNVFENTNVLGAGACTWPAIKDMTLEAFVSKFGEFGIRFKTEQDKKISNFTAEARNVLKAFEHLP